MKIKIFDLDVYEHDGQTDNGRGPVSFIAYVVDAGNDNSDEFKTSFIEPPF